MATGAADEPSDDGELSAADAHQNQLQQLGGFIRDQREKAELSMRELAKRAEISNPYLSQIERGLHEPSVRVLTSLATALNVSAEALLRGAGMLGDVDGGSDANRPDTEAAIGSDPRLTDDQRRSLLTVYRSYVGSAS